MKYVTSCYTHSSNFQGPDFALVNIEDESWMMQKIRLFKMLSELDPNLISMDYMPRSGGCETVYYYWTEGMPHIFGDKYEALMGGEPLLVKGEIDLPERYQVEIVLQELTLNKSGFYFQGTIQGTVVDVETRTIYYPQFYGDYGK